MVRNSIFTLMLVIAVGIALGCGGLFDLGRSEPRIPTQAFYTIDDGQTWYADDIKLLAPYEKDGKQAYRIYIYRCGRDGEPFAGHMERYTPEAKAKLEAARNQPVDSPMPPMMLDLEMQGREIKKPGDTEWVSMANMRGVERIISPKCPDGQMLEVVMP